MADQSNLVSVNKFQAAQIPKPCGPAESGCKGRRIGVTVPTLIEVEYRIAAARQFDGVGGLGFAGVDVAVNGQYCRYAVVRRGTVRNIKQCTEGRAIGILKADIPDCNCAEVGLDQPGPGPAPGEDPPPPGRGLQGLGRGDSLAYAHDTHLTANSKRESSQREMSGRP